jgi:predicted nucleic acid-binding protein
LPQPLVEAVIAAVKAAAAVMGGQGLGRLQCHQPCQGFAAVMVRRRARSPGRKPRRTLMLVIDAELLSVLRRLVLAGALQEGHALQALATADRLGLRRYPSRALWPRAWELRANLSADDALYVALAEQLDAPLLTADARLATGRHAAAPSPGLLRQVGLIRALLCCPPDGCGRGGSACPPSEGQTSGRDALKRAAEWGQTISSWSF